MSAFNVIAASGHCGTTWLAKVLDSQPGVTWYHHFREEMTGESWEVLDLKSPDDKMYDQYWRWVKGHLMQGDVGDSNSWPPHLLPAVDRKMPIQRVIYLTRNKVQQLNSLITTSPAYNKGPLHPLSSAAKAKLKILFDIAPEVPKKEFYLMEHYEKLCLMVAANDFMPDWLRQHGLAVDVYSLEELTKDVDVLAQLAPGLDEETLTRWQRKDINRKTTGGRAESTIWRKWPKELKEAYRAVIG